jgi:AraC-like DNA-binding protein
VAYRELAPPPALRGLVECGWVSTLGSGAAPQVRDVLPDGCMDLLRIGDEMLIAGPDTAPHPVRLDAGVPVAGLRFVPGALPGLLGVPASALRDQRVPLAEVYPRAARPAAPRVGAAGRASRDPGAREPGPGCDGEDARAILAGVAATALALPGIAPPDPFTRELASRIGSGAGAAATADALGCTTRTLHRQCLAAFGYGPAMLRRVLRFRRASAMLHAGMAPAEVAALAGYADQPHLSREVRALAGVAPRQLASGANTSTPLPSGSSTTA